MAKRYVITDSGRNLLDFAAQMRGLTSGSLVFHTLPIKGYATIDNQDANAVDPPTSSRSSEPRSTPSPLPPGPGTTYPPARTSNATMPGSLDTPPAPHSPSPAVPTSGPQGGAVHAVNGIICVD